MTHPIAIVTHYRFAPSPLTNLEALKATIHEDAQANSLKGTFLIAEEGINVTMAGEPEPLKHWFAQLPTLIKCEHWQAIWQPESATTEPLWSQAESIPFGKLVVAIRPEIVTFRDEQSLPSQGGEHVTPQEWDSIINNKNTVTLDVRNDFEVKLGSFTHAKNPTTNTFTEFKAYVEENIDQLKQADQVAMFCTGGIRCEKASAYLKNQGINQVKQLKGGILNYLKATPPKQSNWHGECFVFDNRVTLGHDLKATNNYRREKDQIVSNK